MRKNTYKRLGTIIADFGFGSKSARTAEAEYPNFDGSIGIKTERYYRNCSADSEKADSNIREASEILDGIEDSKDVDISDNQKGVHLFGHKYIPKKPNGKAVIIFTGSGSPGAVQIKNCLKNYIDNRTTVIQYDYRGFGKSTDIDANGNIKPTEFSEETAYEDAHIIYENVIADMKLKPSDVILHGYSMGGPIAAKLAADIAQNAASHNSGHIITGEANFIEEQRLGGIVLHSPMPSIPYAYRKCAPFGLKTIAGFLGKITAGKFDTEEHLAKLKLFDPNIPIHYIGGGTKDWLCPSRTKIFEKVKFDNQCTEIGEHGHSSECKRGNKFIKKICESGRRGF